MKSKSHWQISYEDEILNDENVILINLEIEFFILDLW